MEKTKKDLLISATKLVLTAGAFTICSATVNMVLPKKTHIFTKGCAEITGAVGASYMADQLVKHAVDKLDSFNSDKLW